MPLYTSLELSGYTRLRVKQIDRFQIRPAERIQLILGSNGSGKSSVLSQLNPLAPNKDDFTKEGHKTLKITYHGHQYVLHSVFNPVKHSFKRDGEELNPGGTARAFNELARQEFNYTPEVKALLTGHELFTKMSPNRRKDWFTKLSEVNYDYALSVFNRVKERARDVVGALKTAKKRLALETSKLISHEDEARLRTEVRALEAQLEVLQAVRAPVTVEPAEAERRLQQQLSRLNEVSKQFLNRSQHLEASRQWTSIEEIDDVIQNQRQQLAAEEALMNQALDEHRKLSEQFTVLSKAGSEGVEALKGRVKRLMNEKQALIAKKHFGLTISDCVAARSALKGITDDLTQIALEISPNHDRRYTQASLKDLEDLVAKSQEEKRLKELGLQEMHVHLKAMESHRHDGQTKCPRCQHSWVFGWDPVKVEELKQLIVNTTNEATDLQILIDELKDRLNEYAEYRRLYSEFSRITRAWPVLDGFWHYLTQQQTLIEAPKQIVTLLGQLAFDLDQDFAVLELSQQQHELETLIQQTTDLGDANLEVVQKQLDALDLRVAGLTRAIAQLRGEIQVLQQQRLWFKQLLDLKAQVLELTVSSAKAREVALEQTHLSLIQQAISHFQQQLAIRAESLSAIQLQVGIVRDLEDQIGRLEVEDQGAKELIKTLSPHEGLIADGLLGFIRVFTGQMNALIQKIWSYPLVVKPCGTSTEQGAELDYRFPVRVDDPTNIISDVGDGSSGMQEIINLAFMVVAMRHLGLGDTALLLDEFGKTLDKEHRLAASTVIKSLMDTQAFSQLFMISHYEESYGAFTNAELCVLCSNNITIPAKFKYNQHVTIE